MAMLPQLQPSGVLHGIHTGCGTHRLRSTDTQTHHCVLHTHGNNETAGASIDAIKQALQPLRWQLQGYQDHDNSAAPLSHMQHSISADAGGQNVEGHAMSIMPVDQSKRQRVQQHGQAQVTQHQSTSRVRACDSGTDRARAHT